MAAGERSGRRGPVHQALDDRSRTFWLGDTAGGDIDDRRMPGISAPLRQTLPAMAWGVTLPWALLLAGAAGAWVMVAPAVLGSEGWAATSNHLTGAIIVTATAVALAEVTRAARFVNVLLGFWVIVTPWVLSGATGAAVWSNAVAGLIVMGLSLPRGRVREQYGGWERYIM